VRGANGRRVSRGRFRVVGCGAFRLDFDGGLGGEAEETALFLPIMRQVFAQSHAREERAHDFRAEIGQPNNQLWVADITYITIEAGFVYLAVILDAWSRRVVGYAISRSIDARLAIAALKSASANAIRRRAAFTTRIAVRNMHRPITDSSSPHMASLAP
jgi:transposase InsO family protein